MDMTTVTAPVPIFLAIILHARFANGAAHFVILFDIIKFRGIPWAALLVGDGDGSVWPYVLEKSNLLPLGFHLGDLISIYITQPLNIWVCCAGMDGFFGDKFRTGADWRCNTKANFPN